VRTRSALFAACVLLSACAAKTGQPAAVPQPALASPLIVEQAHESWVHPFNTRASVIAVASDGAIWVNEDLNFKVARFNLDGTYVEFPVPEQGPFVVTRDAIGGVHGSMYFAVNFGSHYGILRVLRSGSVKVFRTPRTPTGLGKGPDGTIWATLPNGHVVHLLSDGTFVSYALPTPPGLPYGITTGSDGNIWFSVHDQHMLDRLDPTTGVITEYPTQDCGPLSTLSVPRGNLWLSCDDGSIVEYTTQGTNVATCIACSVFSGYSHQLAYEPSNGRIWATVNNVGIVGLDPATGNYDEHKDPLQGGQTEIAAAPDGNIWLAEQGSPWISIFVRRRISTVPQSVTVSSGGSQTITVTEAHYHASWSATSSNTACATVTANGPNTFLVTGVGTGSCTVTVNDTKSNSLGVPVTVR